MLKLKENIAANGGEVDGFYASGFTSEGNERRTQKHATEFLSNTFDTLSDEEAVALGLTPGA